MNKTKISALIALIVIGLVISAIPVATAPNPLRPMIFVHGGSGSVQQWETQAMRFTSNGYPANYIRALEYDSSFTINTMAQIWARLDTLIATLLAETGADKVDLLGHSLGTMVDQGYLAFPTRAANVAHYVNIDGASASAPPGGVPTLAIWGMPIIGPPGTREIVGAKNVYFLDKTHVEVCTCAESFFEMYKFFTGEKPEEKGIVPEHGHITLAGWVGIFPLNLIAPPGTLEIWEINSDTGARIHKTPEAVYPISGNGAWGPFRAKAGANYEFAFVRPGDATHHFYREPIVRDDYWVRFHVSSPAYGGVASYMNRSATTSCLVISRMKEFWGDQGANNDILMINGVNVINANNCYITKLVNAMFVYDKDLDGISDPTTPIPVYHALTFFTGIDLYMPGATPPTGTITLVSRSRGMPGKSRAVINIPNWASLTDRISVQFNDYTKY